MADCCCSPLGSSTPPPSGGAGIILTSNLAQPWQVTTPLPVNDAFVTLPQFVAGAQSMNPFLVCCPDGLTSGGNGSDASILSNGGTPRSLNVSAMLTFQVTFSAGVGGSVFFASLFDELGNEIAGTSIFVFPSTSLLRLALAAAPFALAAGGKLFLETKKNDVDSTISGSKLLDFSLAASVAP